MKKLLTILLLFVFSLSFAQKKKKSASDPFAGLDTAFQRVLKDRKAAGFAVAVVYKDTILYAKGFGYRDYENKIPVTAQTVFAIGSCTKAFTASIMGLLNKEAEVDFDKPVRTYLPQLHFINDNLNDHVTIRDMMCHRTGLPRHDFSWFLFNSPSKDSLLQRIAYQEPTAELREAWQYNNFMYLAQGVIAEKLTGKTWEQNVQEKLFDPLAMKSSNLTINGLKKNKEASLCYTVYKDSIIKKMDYYDISGMSPAGSINSNVMDMANWVSTWINGGKFHNREILPEAYVKDAISSQMVIGAAFPSKEIPDIHLATYGFGWMLSSYRGHYRVEHGGNINGFSASTCFFPTDSIGIIVLTNQNGSAVTGIVRNMLADRLLNIKPIDWNGRANEEEVKAKQTAAVQENAVSIKKENAPASHALAAYTGIFNNPGYGDIEIIQRKDSLIWLSQVGDNWLRHYQYDVFEALTNEKDTGIDTLEKNSLKLQFHMNTAGEINAVTMPLQPGIKDIEFTRKQVAKPLSKEELSAYTGEYELGPGVVAKFYLKGENTLYAFIEGQPEYELVANGNDRFSLKVLDGYSVQFEKNDQQEVVTATFVQPNGKFKAKKIK